MTTGAPAPSPSRPFGTPLQVSHGGPTPSLLLALWWPHPRLPVVTDPESPTARASGFPRLPRPCPAALPLPPRRCCPAVAAAAAAAAKPLPGSAAALAARRLPNSGFPTVTLTEPPALTALTQVSHGGLHRSPAAAVAVPARRQWPRPLGACPASGFPRCPCHPLTALAALTKASHGRGGRRRQCSHHHSGFPRWTQPSSGCPQPGFPTAAPGHTTAAPPPLPHHHSRFPTLAPTIIA